MNLNELKIGDQVVVASKPIWSNNARYELHTVKRFTPTTVVLDNEQVYYKGSYRRLGAPVGTEYKIVPITSDIGLQIAKKNGISFLNQMDWDLLSSEKILEIIKIINKELHD